MVNTCNALCYWNVSYLHLHKQPIPMSVVCLLCPFRIVFIKDVHQYAIISLLNTQKTHHVPKWVTTKQLVPIRNSSLNLFWILSSVWHQWHSIDNSYKAVCSSRRASGVCGSDSKSAVLSIIIHLCYDFTMEIKGEHTQSISTALLAA